MSLECANRQGQINKYLTDTAPWDLARKETTKQAADVVVYNAAESLRIMGILLQPFIPEKAAELLDILGVQPRNRTLALAKVGADLHYGRPMRPYNVGRGRWQGLFPQLPVET